MYIVQGKEEKNISEKYVFFIIKTEKMGFIVHSGWKVV